MYGSFHTSKHLEVFDGSRFDDADVIMRESIKGSDKGAAFPYLASCDSMSVGIIKMFKMHRHIGCTHVSHACCMCAVSTLKLEAPAAISIMV